MEKYLSEKELEEELELIRLSDCPIQWDDKTDMVEEIK
jgi:hypothetical protein